MEQTINHVYQHHLQLHEHNSHGVQFDNFVQMLNIFFLHFILNCKSLWPAFFLPIISLNHEPK